MEVSDFFKFLNMKIFYGNTIGYIITLKKSPLINPCNDNLPMVSVICYNIPGFDPAQDRKSVV